MQKVIEFIENRKEQHLAELTELLRIPSISTLPEHKSDVAACAEWMRAHVESIGLSNAQLFETPGHPIVYAEYKCSNPDAPTVLFYGHYDVQPVDPLHLWTNPPFEPVVRDGKIFARGAVDDKGQVLMHLKAIEAHLKVNGSFPVNLKVMIEGEEESGSVNLEDFLRTHQDLLKCDAVMICDTDMYAPGQPAICYGLRGLTYMQISVTGPNRDLHSGMFGGAVENPINVLCDMISKMKDEYGRIAIPGFYDGIMPVSKEERDEIAKLPHDEDAYCAELDVFATDGEFGYSTVERTWIRPTLDVNGIWGGFTGEGAKTVLPSKAYAKISMRLVPGQNTDDIARKFIDYVNHIAPPTVKVQVDNLHGGNPVICPIDSKFVKAAEQALARAYGKEPFYTRSGGSIPITLLFQEILSAPSVMMGFGLATENAHSPDEHFHLENFYTGIVASAHYYDCLASL